ncbi:MAG: Uncharacterised protein [Flavobacterium sp. SCGC AAA160-P02]|nr:MAG: Uncharacterised protein [Flavobacterium sp. SCGC AAA160-P02]
MKNIVLSSFFVLLFSFSKAQKTVPDNIKSIQLKPLGINNFNTIVPLGKTLELNFDDLDGDQKDYYYKIELMTYDWKKSNLISNQYINGFQSNIIFNVENSFNTFQNYTHYSVQFPNQNTIITRSGNYLVSILDEVGDIIFSRRFTLYENTATIGISASRSRNTKNMNEEQTVNFIVNYSQLQINNPSQEIHVAILQNENWKTALTNIKPQFYKPNQLIYRYTNKTNFWGGNEYLFFDNKIIRNTSINIARTERREIFHNYLYPYKNRSLKSYTYNPDINGQFIIRTIEGSDPNTEADYAMVYFSLEVQDEIINKDVYVYGGFNNFSFSEENKMIYDAVRKTYYSNFLLKQGFYNYTFVTRSSDNRISESEIRGNFSDTENNYSVIVYYKAFGSIFDRVIGASTIKFEGER